MRSPQREGLGKACVDGEHIHETYALGQWAMPGSTAMLIFFGAISRRSMHKRSRSSARSAAPIYSSTTPASPHYAIPTARRPRQSLRRWRAYSRDLRARAMGNAGVYRDVDIFWRDLAAVYAQEVAQLGALGCTYLQLDDTSFATLCDPHSAKASAKPASMASIFTRPISASSTKR